MSDDYTNEACPICKGTEFKWGALHAKGTGLKAWIGAKPKNAYFFSRGPLPEMRVCVKCGNIQLFLEEKP